MLKGLCHEIRELWSCVLTLDPVSGFTQLIVRGREPNQILEVNARDTVVDGREELQGDQRRPACESDFKRAVQPPSQLVSKARRQPKVPLSASQSSGRP